jgi:hypothetical protein
MGLGRIAHAIRWFFEILLYPFDQMPPWLGLTLSAVLCGGAMIWVFGKVTSQSRIQNARNKMVSAIYEVRLFLDSPRRVTTAMGRLLGWSFAHLGLMLPAFLIMGGPLMLLGLHLDLRYGVAPVETQKPIVVRVDLKDPATGDNVRFEKETNGVTITSPPLYVKDEGRVFVRLKVTEPAEQRFWVRLGKKSVSKKITASPYALKASPQKSAGLAALWSFGLEDALDSDAGIQSITVTHPRKAQKWPFSGVEWWLYWLVVAMISAYALSRPLGVEI